MTVNLRSTKCNSTKSRRSQFSQSICSCSHLALFHFTEDKTNNLNQSASSSKQCFSNSSNQSSSIYAETFTFDFELAVVFILSLILRLPQTVLYAGRHHIMLVFVLDSIATLVQVHLSSVSIYCSCSIK